MPGQALSSGLLAAAQAHWGAPSFYPNKPREKLCSARFGSAFPVSVALLGDGSRKGSSAHLLLKKNLSLLLPTPRRFILSKVKNNEKTTL
ncbi:hypothetical protein GN956_G20878 [Arapaima gigas]